MSHITARKVLPLEGHKCLGARPAVVVYCECGWTSCPHTGESARGDAYSEWRDHTRSHGAAQEPAAQWLTREDRERAKLSIRTRSPNNAG
jgi:hypothetical protein